jgi:hypothetical protein
VAESIACSDVILSYSPRNSKNGGIERNILFGHALPTYDTPFFAAEEGGQKLKTERLWLGRSERTRATDAAWLLQAMMRAVGWGMTRSI